MTTQKVLSGLIVVAVVLLGIAYFAFPRIKEVVKVGVWSGPDIYNKVLVHDKFVDGGGVTNASTSLTTALTLTAKQLCDSSVITVNSAAAATLVAEASLDITLPATSTLFTTCLQENGAHLSFLFSNLSPTAASTTQIVAGAGMDLLECDDSSDCNVEIGGNGRAIIELWRQSALESNTDIYVTVTEYTAAD